MAWTLDGEDLIDAPLCVEDLPAPPAIDGLCTICKKASASVVCGPNDRACAQCSALVRELETKWSEDLAATVEDLQPVTMQELVVNGNKEGG